MATTRVYRSLVDTEGNAISGQNLLAVPTGEDPNSSPNKVSFTEKTLTMGGTTYATGEYYADLDPGLWDFYVQDQSGVWKVYQENQWVGGVDLLTGGYLGFTVYESPTPVPNDGQYWMTKFPATGLDGSSITLTLMTPGALYDASSLTSAPSEGMIYVKISAPVNEGAHIAEFTQNGVTTRTIYRVVDVASQYMSPVYNYLRNPEFASDVNADNIPDYWNIISYATTSAYTMGSISDPSITLSLTDAAADEAIYILQTAKINGPLIKSQQFSFSIEADLTSIGNLSGQLSAVAINRSLGSDTVLNEAGPITISDTSRVGLLINAPTDTTHIRVVLSLTNKTGATVSGTHAIKYYRAKLNAGVDINWYS